MTYTYVVGNIKMKKIKAEILTNKTHFSNYEDYKTYPTSDLKCPSCEVKTSIAFKDLEKHRFSNFSNLTEDKQNKINEFVKLNMEKVPNSFLDYNCPNCNSSVRLYYQSWAGGRHGENGYELEMVISD